jgi:hypothetical protein
MANARSALSEKSVGKRIRFIEIMPVAAIS